MAPPLPHDPSKPAERDPATIKAIVERWGPAAVGQLYAHLPFGSRWARFRSHGRLAWVTADSSSTGPTLFARVGSTFTPFPMPRFGGAPTEAFAAVLEDALPDVVADKDSIIEAFAAVTGAEPVLTEAAATSVFLPTFDSAGNRGVPAQFEPPHFRGRTLAFVAAFPYEGRLVRVLVDGETLALGIEPLGATFLRMMPVG